MKVIFSLLSWWCCQNYGVIVLGEGQAGATLHIIIIVSRRSMFNLYFLFYRCCWLWVVGSLGMNQHQDLAFKM